MGFKCPMCSKDFGNDKPLWCEHCKSCCGGAAADIVKLVTSLPEPPKPETEDTT